MKQLCTAYIDLVSMRIIRQGKSLEELRNSLKEQEKEARRKVALEAQRKASSGYSPLGNIPTSSPTARSATQTPGAAARRDSSPVKVFSSLQRLFGHSN